MQPTGDIIRFVEGLPDDYVQVDNVWTSHALINELHTYQESLLRTHILSWREKQTRWNSDMMMWGTVQRDTHETYYTHHIV